jgi:hypothetical protein
MKSESGFTGFWDEQDFDCRHLAGPVNGKLTETAMSRIIYEG